MGYLIPVLIALALVVVIFILISVFVGRYVKVGPDEALIVSGRKKRLPNGQVVGFRIVKGGATFVWPVLEKAKTISLRIMPLDVNSSAYTSQGVQVNVDGVAQVKIDSTHEAIATAAEQFLSLKEEEIRRHSDADPGATCVLSSATSLSKRSWQTGTHLHKRCRSWRPAILPTWG